MWYGLPVLPNCIFIFIRSAIFTGPGGSWVEDSTPDLLLGAGRRLSQGFASVFCFYFGVLNFLNFARLQSLNSDWAWVLKWKFCCTMHSHRFSLRSSGVGRYWSGKVGYWYFLPFFFLLIRPRDLHCTDTSLLSKRRSISRVHTQNCCAWTYPTRQKFRRFEAGRRYKVTAEITSATPRRMVKIACDLTAVKCTKDSRRWLQKFALPATKLRKNVKAPSAGCCDSLLFLFLSLSRLICKPESHVFWAWSRINTICIDGRVVGTSDSESVGRGSIHGGRKSNFFPPFFSSWSNFFFSSFQSRMIYQNKSEKL